MFRSICATEIDTRIPRTLNGFFGGAGAACYSMRDSWERLAPYDELIDAQDHPRPGWAPVWAYLNNKSNREFRYADEQVQRELSEQEITGSVHDAEDGTQRGWQLDSIPFVLDQNEWRSLRSGLSQRAQTLEAILQDLYGERRLLAQSWFPQQLMYEHPGYLRPMVGPAGPAFFAQLCG